MVKTGLMNQLFSISLYNKEAFQVDQNSPSKQAWRDGMNTQLEILKEILRDGDFDTLVAAEKFSLQEELQEYANSPEQIASIKAAQQQLHLADETIDLIRKNEEGYRGLAKGIKVKDINKDGTPTDRFRAFLNGHKTRLNNKLAAALSVPEKNILRLRKDIVKEMERQYKQMQREVLRLPQEITKGLER